MKIIEARDLMRRQGGYRVHFEKRGGGLLSSDFFPDRDEPGIVDRLDAWKLAEQWAVVDPDVYVNIYVIYAHDFTPVDGYSELRLNTYPKVREASCV